MHLQAGSSALRLGAAATVCGLLVSLGSVGSVGCSYSSSYTAPTDGRPRVVWVDDSPAVDLAGSQISADCGGELRRITQHETMPTRAGNMALPERYVPSYSFGVGSEFWVPRYYGPQIYIVRPGFAPPLIRPPLFLPSLVRPGSIHLAAPSGGHGGGGMGRIGTGGGGGGNVGKGAAILVVLAVSVMPAIAIGLAASTPESPTRSAQAIDLVNAYNDLARSSGTPCSFVGGAP